MYKRLKFCYFILMTAKEFWDKIKSILNERKLTFVWLCEEAGVSLQIMKNRIYKERIPDVDNTLKLLAVLGITFEEFFGVEDLFPVKKEIQAGKSEMLPVYEDFTRKKIEDYIAVPEDLKTKRFEGHLFAVKMGGDSMAPAISNGDTVICDDFGYQADGLYAIVFNEMCCVKRLQWISGGIKIISDNKQYEAMFVKADSKEFKVIGKVLYVLHKV